MNRLILAVSLHMGMLLLFVVVVISLLHSASILTAVARGVGALGTFALLGSLAGLASRVKSTEEDSGSR